MPCIRNLYDASESKTQPTVSQASHPGTSIDEIDVKAIMLSPMGEYDFPTRGRIPQYSFLHTAVSSGIAS